MQSAVTAIGFGLCCGTVEKRKEIVEQSDQKGVQAMPPDNWWKTGVT